VANETLPPGTGEPDQVVVLSKTPVVPGSVRLTVTVDGRTETWEEIDDLLSAGPEVDVRDPRLPPGAPLPRMGRADVFTCDPESGQIRFGDGLRGKRPPRGASLRVDYDYAVGRDGNVGRDSINSIPALPAGFKVTNPVPTWGGADAETVADLGRVEVIPAFNPDLPQNEPGDAPGAVTLMVIPRYDPAQPDAPLPDRLFLDAICDYVDPRRLVTTEVFLRGPVYKQIWVSVGITVAGGVSVSDVRQAVQNEVRRFLFPLPEETQAGPEPPFLSTPSLAGHRRGWPLRKPVVALELQAVASRVRGVMLVNPVQVAEGRSSPEPSIPMNGLELPRVMAISVAIGDPVPLDDVRGQAPVAQQVPPTVPVPVIPEEC
jgi:hypothetical protein